MSVVKDSASIGSLAARHLRNPQGTLPGLKRKLLGFVPRTVLTVLKRRKISPLVRFRGKADLMEVVREGKKWRVYRRSPFRNFSVSVTASRVT